MDPTIMHSKKKKLICQGNTHAVLSISCVIVSPCATSLVHVKKACATFVHDNKCHEQKWHMLFLHAPN